MYYYTYKITPRSENLDGAFFVFGVETVGNAGIFIDTSSDFLAFDFEPFSDFFEFDFDPDDVEASAPETGEVST